ncbi:MAG: VCBS repeat-containing protein, partial [Anaerolineales bacterium]|nr:VCBS repeat-containing protein [Anaerolineales bacterium]
MKAIISRRQRRFIKQAALIFAPLFLLCLLAASQPIHAQFESPTNSYWRHSASLRLQHVLPIDINHDGIDEVIIVTENGDVDLISADGISLWQYGAAAPVHAIGTVNLDGPDNPDREIVLALTNRLVVLSVDGKEMWETAVSAVTPPTSLYTHSSETFSQAWQAQYDAVPIAVQAIDRNGDGWEEIAVLLQSGRLHLYDANGALQWRYTRGTTPGLNAEGRLAVGDLNGDGQEEIVLATFRRFSQMTIIDGEGVAQWDQPIGISGHVTALTLVDFPEYNGVEIAVGTDRGNLNLYDRQRSRIWPRTLNKPITTLAAANLETGPALIVGTAVGTVTAFSGEGRRLWTRQLAEQANRPIIALAALPYLPDDRQPHLSAILGSENGGPEPNDIWL